MSLLDIIKLNTGKVIVGIYKIISPSGKIYIGQSIDIIKRFLGYKNSGCKRQQKLNNSFIKYGVENHAFEILHICDENELNDLEEKYVDQFKSSNELLNIRGGGGAKGKTAEETKEKLRQINLGKKYSSEINLKKGRKGRKSYNAGGHLSEAHKKKLSIAFSGSNNPNYGKKHSDEVRKIISEKVKSSSAFTDSFTPEMRKNVSQRFKGKPKSPEQKLKMSLAAKGVKKSKEASEKSRLSRTGIKRREESKRRQSETTRGVPKTIEQKTRSGNGLRRYWQNIKQERLTMIF
jgi:group I intron endonuclease